MLIIGDVAIKDIDKSAKIDVIEIIFNGATQLQLAKNILNLKNPERVNYCTVRYSGSKKKVYLMHNAAEDKTLRDILDYSFSNNLAFKVAKPIIQHIFNIVKVKYIHKTTEEWQKSVFSYLYINKKYIEDLEKSHVKNSIYKLSILLHQWMQRQPSTSHGTHIYRPYDYTTKDELLDVIKFRNKSSFKSLWIGQSRLLFSCVWNKLKEEEKMEAVLESLYLDTLNEYIVPDHFEHNREFTEQEVTSFFKTSVMNATTRADNKWFNSFILLNYIDIMRKYTPEFYKWYLLEFTEEKIKQLKK